MLAARGQENVAQSHRNAALLKQQHRNANTPLKVPLNDENAVQAKGGAKGAFGTQSKGAENVLTSKASKGKNQSVMATPMDARSRAPLGAKTTNAKAKGLATVNVKSAVNQLEKSQKQETEGSSYKESRQRSLEQRKQNKQKRLLSKPAKLEVHPERSASPDDQCRPPAPKDLPYKSDVFPDDVRSNGSLRPEDMLRGFHSHYVNPKDENGQTLADRQLAQSTRAALEEGDRRVMQDIENFEWSIDHELQDGPARRTEKRPAALNAVATTARVGSKPRALPSRRPLSTVTSRHVATALSMDDTTKSVQRRTAKPVAAKPASHQRTPSWAFPRPRAPTQPTVKHPTARCKSSLEVRGAEANSRTTMGYNKGRAAASILARGKDTSTAVGRPANVPGAETSKSNDSDKTITQARYANRQVPTGAGDQQWKERIPFLSIFDPAEEEDDLDLGLHSLPPGMATEDEDEEAPELRILD